MDRRVSPRRLHVRWLWAMAWRDARRNLRRLLLFVSSIVLGVAALVAIASFGENQRADIQHQAKGLLGADLLVWQGEAAPDSTHRWYDTLGVARAWETSLPSMVTFPEAEGTRLVQIRALEGDFPFYGSMETEPAYANRRLATERVAIVDRGLMELFGVQVGDSIKVGKLKFGIAGALDRVPGSTEVVSLVAAPVYIPRRYLHDTGLVRFGSQMRTQLFFQLAEGVHADTLKNEIYDRLYAEGWGLETVTDRQESLSRTFNGLNSFLNLVAFVALLLGCIGVASSVHVYIKEKINSVAILRTLGAAGRHGVWIFLLQILGVGLVGSVLGVALGVGIQYYLPHLLASFLPFHVTSSPSMSSMLQGVGTGLAMALLFALLPLLRVRKVAPLRVLRSGLAAEHLPRDRAGIVVVLGILLFVGAFAYWQTQGLREAIFFTLFIAASFAGLLGVARLLMWAVRRFFPRQAPYVWRQGLANLYRPQNQTVVLLAAIGLGSTLLATLTLTQAMLLAEVGLNASENQPNLVLYNIQPAEIEDVREIMSEHPVVPMEEMPVVALRFHTIKGMPIDTLLTYDTTIMTTRRRLVGEMRVSYRRQLMAGESIASGTWYGQHTGDTLWVSLDEGFAELLHLQLGDALEFDVQGVKIKAYLGSTRTIDWGGMRTNTNIVFPAGVLETAPQFYICMLQSPSPQASGAFRRDVAQFFPSITSLDLGTLVRTLDAVVSQVSFVIRFMAMFSILTGILVLIGSVSISKYQQIRESVLLRTLGASRRQIVRITLLEYFLLGSLASLSGIVLSLIATALLAHFQFDIPFQPNLWSLLPIYGGVTALTVGIGALNLRDVVRKPPLAVLRNSL